MNAEKPIWTTYLIALAVIQIPTIILVGTRLADTGIDWARLFLLLMSCLIFVCVPFRDRFSSKSLGIFVISAQLLMIMIGVTVSGPFSAAIASFISLPVVITGIWGLRAGLILLGIGVALLSGFAILDAKALITFPEANSADLASNRQWAIVIYVTITTAVLGAIVADKLRRSWKQSLNEVDKSRSEIQGILDKFIDAFFRCDANGQVVLASPSFLRMNNAQSPAECGPVQDILRDPAHFEAVLADIKQTSIDTPVLHSSTIQTKSGDLLSVDFHLVALFDKEGTYVGYEGLIQDRTALKHSEDGRRTAETQKSTVTENIPGAVYDYILWPDGRESVEFLNSRCEDIWEISKEEAVDGTELIRSKIQEDDRRALRKLVVASQFSLMPFSQRCRITRRDGSILYADIRGRPKTYSDGSHRCHYVALDVTNEVLAQEELARQTSVAEIAEKQKSIGQLTGGVAHDFNNLLAVVLGNLELLQEEQDAERRAVLAQSAIDATLRGSDLTKNMLAFARRTSLEPKILDLNDIVHQTKKWAGRTLPANIDVETSFLAGLWKIEADPSSLEAALLNLIVNARDAMPDGGKLTIETSNVRIDDAYVADRSEQIAPGRYVMLAVSDTGTGIPPDVLKHIFDPFFTTKEPGSGSGLGLSMIEGFTRQSGGATRVYSEVGVGTTFKLYFKAMSGNTSADPAIPQRSEAMPDTSQTIFVVEDERGVLDVLVAVLQKAGYGVLSASSGDEAYNRFQDGVEADLLITDIVMPGTLQGTTLAKTLREDWPDLPVVFMSGYAAEATVHGNGLRAEDIRLMKPVRSADLLKSVRQALETSRQAATAKEE